MPRKATLTDIQRKENAKKSKGIRIEFYVQESLDKKIEKFSKQYKSRNKAIIDLINTHPEFLKMFPKDPIVNIRGKLHLI